MATPANITTLYRQNVSNFLAYTDACLQERKGYNPPDDSLVSWIGDTARSLALRAANHDANTVNAATQQASHNTSAKKKSSVKPANASPADMIRALPPNWSDFMCLSCGAFLFPPAEPNKVDDNGCSSTTSLTNIRSIQSSQISLPSNIYLRPLKRGRTRRRRASRAKAKQLHNHSLSLQRRGTSNTSTQLQNNTLVKEEMQRIASSYCLGDGRAKNCLVVKCTYCGTKRKRKGVEVKSSQKMVQAGGGNKASQGKKKNQGSQSEKRTERSVTSQIHDNTDFISLSGNSTAQGTKSVGQKRTLHGKPMAGKRKQQDVISEPFNSPLLGGKKKKKKKKAEPKKGGNLMDFLSSLND